MLVAILLQVIQIGRVQRNFFDHFSTDDLGRAARVLACSRLRRGLSLTNELLGLSIDFLDAIRALNDPIHLVLRRPQQITHPSEVLL